VRRPSRDSVLPICLATSSTTDLRKGRLVSVLPRFVINERSIFAVYAPSRFIPPKVRLFVDALQKAFRKKS